MYKKYSCYIPNNFKSYPKTSRTIKNKKKKNSVDIDDLSTWIRRWFLRVFRFGTFITRILIIRTVPPTEIPAHFIRIRRIKILWLLYYFEKNHRCCANGEFQWLYYGFSYPKYCKEKKKHFLYYYNCDRAEKRRQRYFQRLFITILQVCLRCLSPLEPESYADGQK